MSLASVPQKHGSGVWRRLALNVDTRLPEEMGYPKRELRAWRPQNDCCWGSRKREVRVVGEGGREQGGGRRRGVDLLGEQGEEICKKGK